MIDQNTINRIMDVARIEDVIGEFVNLRKRGVNYIGLCPFHDEKTPSFSVSPSKGICKCFSCGKGGNVVHFIMEHEQLSYYEALKWLAKKYNIEVVEKELTPEEKQNRDERESMFIINEFARDYFNRTMKEDTEGKSIGGGYFRERGIREDIIQKFQLGYCPERRDGFSQTAINKGYQKDLLIKTGLSIEDNQGRLFDRYRGRVIFPVHTVSGKVVAFGGRILKKSDKLAKYINSPESEIYHKSAELYGIYFAKQQIVKQDRCYLVEGYIDVLSMHQAGIENVVASSGTSLTHGQIRLIHRFTENVTVLYDGDAAGIKASLRGINLLLEEGLNIKVVLLPDGEDPDSYAQSHSASEVTEYIKQHETDFIRFKTDILLKECHDDPISRAALIEDLIESIALIPNEIIRSEYIRECSRLLGTREELLLKELNKKRYQVSERNRQKREIEKRYPAQGSSYTQGGSFQGGYSTQGRNGNVPPDSEDVPFPDSRYMPADNAGVNVSGDGSSVSGESASGEAASGKSDFGTFFSGELTTAGSAAAGPATSGGKRKTSPFDPFEKNLLKMVVRYGERILYEEKDEDDHLIRKVSVLDYICEDLKNEDIVFLNPLYNRMLEEAYSHRLDNGFIAERYFLQHEDNQISLLSADLSGERYELSKLYFFDEKDDTKDILNKISQKKIEAEEDTLDKLIPRLLEDLKYKILKEKLKEAKKHIKQAQMDKNEQDLMHWMEQFTELQQIERAFAKELGERIISL